YGCSLKIVFAKVANNARDLVKFLVAERGVLLQAPAHNVLAIAVEVDKTAVDEGFRRAGPGLPKVGAILTRQERSAEGPQVASADAAFTEVQLAGFFGEIGRASCRERV